MHSSGTLPAKSDSGPSHPAITEGPMVSSLSMMSQTRYAGTIIIGTIIIGPLGIEP